MLICKKIELKDRTGGENIQNTFIQNGWSDKFFITPFFVLFIAAVMIDFKYTEISQMKRFCTLLTLKNRSINIYATCVKSHIADDQISHITNQVPDFVHLRILSAFQNETRRK